MRRSPFIPLVIVFTFTAASFRAQAPAAKAPIAKAIVQSVASARRAVAAKAETAVQLPVTRVSLYKNGVGFFEHSGQVTGSQPVTIDFTTAQLNDVLQSLTAIDLNGGRIAGAGYNSTTPFDQQLKSLPLALGLDPTEVDFYNAIRGARVEVRSGMSSITGRLLNIEVVDASSSNNDKTAAEKHMITVISDSGDVRTLELTPSTEVRLIDAALHQDVSRYLELLASTRNQGLRHLTLQDNAPVGATGGRELHVSYISEVPIWKSTYRILFTSPATVAAATPPAGVQTATLQGWSVVDNTTGADWVNVQLSLIAGAPQSFIQPLSVPYYSRRPQISLPQEAQLTPQTHVSGDEMKSHDSFAVTGMQGQTNSLAGFSNGDLGGRTASMANGSGLGVGSGSGSGLGPGSGGNYGGGVRAIGGGAVMSSDDSSSFQLDARNSISPNTTTTAFDDYFAYNLAEPITIRKNESAMVPILQTKIDAERVTLWSPQRPTPLRALWITNTSNLTLDRGSFSIVEDGNFGGQGLLDPIHPAEKRLLSYAVDQAVRVTTEQQYTTVHATSVTASKGVLMIRHTQDAEITYVVHNAAPEARTVVVEHPIRQNFTLDSDTKPEETTPTLYRFRVAAGSGETIRLHVGERNQSTVSYQLTNSNENQLAVIVNQANNSPALQTALQPILTARRTVADAQTALDKIDTSLKSLRADEDRQRSNVTALGNADKTSRERFVRDLNATEDRIAAAQKDQTAAQAALQTAKDALAGKIEALQIDQTL